MANELKKQRKILTKRKVIILSVLVLAVVTLGVFWLLNRGEETSPTNEANPQPMEVLSSKDISDKIENTQNDEEKAKLYLDLGSSKQGEGNSQEALDAALTSSELKPTHESYALAGAMYRALEQNDKALEMYLKAIELTDKTEDPSEVSHYNNYRLEINELEG